MKLYRVNIGYGDVVTFDLVLLTTHLSPFFTVIYSCNQIPYKQLGMELLSSDSYYVLDCTTELYPLSLL